MLEAMACGTPVICSNRGSLPEIGGDAVVTFNPDNPRDICQIIEIVLQNKTRLNKMIDRGYDRAGMYSWSRHCNQIIMSYEESQNKRN